MRHGPSLNPPVMAVRATIVLAALCAVSLVDDAYGQSTTPPGPATTPTTTPASRTATDQAKLRADRQKLATDRITGHTSSRAADKVQLQDDHAKVSSDTGQVRGRTAESTRPRGKVGGKFPKGGKKAH